MKGDNGPEVAGVCVVESHKDCIEYHNGQLAEEDNEGRLLPPLDAQVDRVHSLCGHVHTVARLTAAVYYLAARHHFSHITRENRILQLTLVHDLAEKHGP